MGSLDVLQRLAKLDVDRERQVLLAISSEIADAEGEIEASLQALECEASASLDFMTTGATLDAFIHAGRARVRAQRERLAGLHKAYDAQIECVRRKRVEQKRFELLIERRAQQEARKTAAKEQKTIDELAAISGRRD